MKKKALVILALVVCAALVLTVAALGGGTSAMERIGALFRGATADDGDTVAARYGDFVVTWADIRYQQGLAPMRMLESMRTTDARTIAERLVGGRLAIEEAERQGLAATDADIRMFVEENRGNYETIPEIRDDIDAFCGSAGISPESYFERLEDQAYDIITLDRFRSQFYESWTAEHTDELPGDPEALMAMQRDAYDAYIATLLEQHQDEIVYYVD